MTADDLSARARMTQYQLMALAVRLRRAALIGELASLPARPLLKRGGACHLETVRRWSLNAWNTEYLLRQNLATLSGDGLRTSLHWAFPQAYYSVFTLALAFFHAAGHTETAHVAVIKKVGELMRAGKYPPSASFLVDGGISRTFLNITRRSLPTTLTFDPTDSTTVDGQICQFLNATRTLDLEERKKRTPVVTVSGKKRVRFRSQDWEVVSRALGATSVLSLLYRKRIKANYQDIDTFLSSDLDPSLAYQNLLQIVASLNLIHESFLFQILGRDDFQTVLTGAACPGTLFVARRAHVLRAGGA